MRRMSELTANGGGRETPLLSSRSTRKASPGIAASRRRSSGSGGRVITRIHYLHDSQVSPFGDKTGFLERHGHESSALAGSPARVFHDGRGGGSTTLTRGGSTRGFRQPSSQSSK